MASKEQLRKMRQRYKLGEYSLKSRKRISKSRVLKKVSTKVMKKRTKKRYFSTAKKVYRKSKDMFAGLFNDIIGTGAVAVIEEPIIQALPPQIKPYSDVLELAGGFFLKNKSGAVGVAGKTMYYSTAKKLIKENVPNLNLPFGGSTNTSSGNGW